MTEPTETPIGVSVAVTDQHTETNTIINNRITIIQRGDGARAPGHHPRPVPHHPSRPPHAGQPITPLKPTLPGAIPPVVGFAADGDTLTTFTSRDGATAVFREDKQNGGAVTLTLQDANGTLITHGDRRGFEASHVNALGQVLSEGVTLDTVWKNPMQIGSVVDKVNCPNTGLKGTNVIPAITSDVTRDKLQQFAAAHPQLANTLVHVALPVTVSGGRQMNFHDAQAAPSEFRACPPHTGKQIIHK